MSAVYRNLLFRIIGFFTFISFAANGQPANKTDRPALVVGIVIDQMRYDYLYRYWDKYSNSGFRKLLNEGYNCRNTQYNYAPTLTGPGHASVYTGTTPALHGIVGNDWYNRETGRNIYCTSDTEVQTIGAPGKAGQMSPRNLQTTTISDQLKLATQQGSKVISVCLKDRGAILPGGHSANAAYWFDGATGRFITSSYYQAALPAWLTTFNNRNLAQTYLSKTWETLLPIKEYTESTADDVPWELPFEGKSKAVFPYALSYLRGQSYDLLRSVPWGNTITKDLALAALDGEQLGKGTTTDMLLISFSSTDYIGHQFGADAIETEDTYLRLDRDLAELLNILEQKIGKNKVLVFLTADHGAAHAPAYLQSLKLPGGTVLDSQMRDSLQGFLTKNYGPGKWLLAYKNQQAYLNKPLMVQHKLNPETVANQLADYAAELPGIAEALTATQLQHAALTNTRQMFMRGYHPERSGDVYLLLKPGWFEAYMPSLLKQGTTHGTAATYDTHVPLLWYGWHIAPGGTAAPVFIADIAPTLADLLHIQEPSGCTGKPILPLLEQH